MAGPCHHLDDDVPASVQRSVYGQSLVNKDGFMSTEAPDSFLQISYAQARTLRLNHARTPQRTNERMHIPIVYTELTGGHWSAASKS